MADRYALSGNWNSTGSWSTTDGGSSGASFPVAGDRVFFTSHSGTITVNVSSACGDIAMTGGTMAGSSALACNGSVSLGGTLTYSGTLTLNATATGKTFTSNGKTFAGNITMNGVGGAWSLADALTCAGTVTLTNGAFSDAGFSLTASVFSSNNTNTRTVTKTGKWTITGTGTCMLVGATNVTWSASGGIAFTDSSSATRTFATGNQSFGGAIQVTAGTGTFSMTGLTSSSTLGGLDFTGFSGSWTTNLSTVNVAGDVILGSGMTVGSNVSPITMTGAGAAHLNPNGVALSRPLTINCAGSVTLQGAVDTSSNQFTHVAGTFNDAGFTVTCSRYQANAGGVGALGTVNKSGNWVCTANGTVADLSTASSLVMNDSGTWTFTDTTAAVAKAFFPNTAHTYNTIDYQGVGTFAIGASALGNLMNVRTLKGKTGNSQAFSFPPGTHTIGSWQVSGNASQTITINGQGTLNHTGVGNVTADYLTFNNITALPGYSWFVGNNSVNGGGNLGVAFCTAANASPMRLAA